MQRASSSHLTPSLWLTRRAILPLSCICFALAVGALDAPTASAQVDAGDKVSGDAPPASEEVMFAPGIYGHPSQREAWDRMMGPTWQISKLAGQTRLEAGLTGEIRPYLLGKMIDQHSGDKGMIFVADWRGQGPSLSRDLDRLGYFEVARQATSHYGMSLVYLVVDDVWAKQTSGAENRRVSALAQRIISRDDLTQEILIEELGKLASSIPGVRWELKQVDFSDKTALLSMRLVQRRNGEHLGARMGFGFELQPRHEEKIDTRDRRRRVLLIASIVSILTLVGWISYTRRRRERRRWEVERDENLCPRCGSAQVSHARTERARCDVCNWRSSLGPMGRKQDPELHRLERVRDGIVSIKAALTRAHSADPTNQLQRQLHKMTNGWAKQLEACNQAQIHLESTIEAGEDVLELTPPEQLHLAFFEQLEDMLDREPDLTRERFERWRHYLLDLHDLLELIELELELRVWATAKNLQHVLSRAGSADLENAEAEEE